MSRKSNSFFSEACSSEGLIIVWDVGGVILQRDKEQFKKHPLYEKYITHVYQSENWKKFDSGHLSFDKLKKIYSEKLNMPEEEIDDLLQTAFHTLRPNMQVVQLIKALNKRGVQQFCLTNGSKEYFAHVSSSKAFSKAYGMTLLDLFPRENIILSADILMRKPQLDIYEHSVKHFKIKNAKKIVFVDDSAPNIQGALDAGWGHCIKFENNESFFEKMKELIERTKVSTTTLKIISISDTHGTDTNFARMYTGIKKEIEQDKQSKENIEHLLVVAGDVFSVNKLLSRHSEGNIDVEALCLLAQLFKCNRRLFLPGNHDFIHGCEKISELVEKGNFQLLVSNAEFFDETGLKPIDVIKVSSGNEMIEFRGLMTPETRKNEKGNAALKNITDTKDLKLEGVSGIIISHLGLHDDELLKTKAHVIGGHSHHECQNFDDTGRFVVNCGAHSRLYSSVLMQDLPAGGPEMSLIYSDQYSPAHEITSLIDKYERGVEEKLNMPEGRLSEKVFEVSNMSKMLSGLDALESSYEEMESHLRISDSCITRLTADAISKKFGGISLIPAAAFRSNFVQGQEVSVRALIEMYYWENKLIKVKTTGAELIKALSRGVLSQPKNWHGRGRLLHPSLQLEYAYDLEADPCAIITSVKHLGDFIDPDETFDVVSTDWIIKKCNLFPNATIVEEYDEKLAFVVAEYAKGTELDEEFSERIICSQNLQWQEELARSNPRGEYHENLDLEINLKTHYQNTKKCVKQFVME